MQILTKFFLLVALTAPLVDAGAATFDPLSGTGQILAPEIQVSHGWTDAQFQERAPALSFRYELSGRYSAVCVWITPQGSAAEERLNQVYRWEALVKSAMRYDPRETKRVLGFQLLGFDEASAVDGALPAMGTPCVGGGGAVGVWSAVTPLSQTRALSARFAGVDVLLPF